MTAVRGELCRFAGSGASLWLVVQHGALAAAPTVTVLAVTERPQRAGPPLTVELGPTDTGLSETTWVKTTQVHTFRAADTAERVGTVTLAAMGAVDRALREVLGLSP